MASEPAWSEWLWHNEHQHYYCYRYNAAGNCEYKWAEETTVPTPTTPQNQTNQPYYNTQQPSYGQETPPSYGNYSSSTGGTNHLYSTPNSSPWTPSRPPVTGHLNNQAVYASNAPTETSSLGAVSQQWTSPVPSQVNTQALRSSQAGYVGNGRETLGPPLHSSYKRVKVGKNQSEFYQTGRVFKTLWVEPAGHDGSGDNFTTTTFGEAAFAQIRRFVVLSSTKEYSRCSPITTYGGQATTKQGVIPEHHSVIYYVHEGQPASLPQEQLTKTAIAVDGRNILDATLGTLSRLDFGRTYTVHHTAKVVNLGMVVKDHRPLLRLYQTQSQ